MNFNIISVVILSFSFLLFFLRLSALHCCFKICYYPLKVWIDRHVLLVNVQQQNALLFQEKENEKTIINGRNFVAFAKLPYANGSRYVTTVVLYHFFLSFMINFRTTLSTHFYGNAYVTLYVTNSQCIWVVRFWYFLI